MAPTAQSLSETTSKATRIDGPHVARTADALSQSATAALPLAVTGSSSGGHELLERQAWKIAEQLRAEQQDLDAREAEFHARVAQLEAELRAQRLRQTEREDELARQSHD
ncbi:MAG TPA: hypothetical protein VIY86_00620, partial [Pirellulaceae bacterium]